MGSRIQVVNMQGEKLQWTFLHTIYIHTWTRREGSAISVALRALWSLTQRCPYQAAIHIHPGLHLAPSKPEVLWKPGCVGREEWVWEGAGTVGTQAAKKRAEDMGIVSELCGLLGGPLSINHSIVQIFGGLDWCFFHVCLCAETGA